MNLEQIYEKKQKFEKRLKLEAKFWLLSRKDKILVNRKSIPPLTDKEINEINNYWGKYGVKFKNYDSFRLFYYITGKKDPRFLPFSFVASVLYPHYNDSTKSRTYADKNMFCKFMPDMKFPKLIGQRINKRYFDETGKYYGEEVCDEYVNHLFEYISKENNYTIILKEAFDTNTGKGVKKYVVTNANILKETLAYRKSENYLIQFGIRQHPFFSQFNNDSVNIIRITTWRKGNKVHIFSPCIRFGIPGSATDVAYVNGHEIVNCIGIDRTGIIFDKGIDLSGNVLEIDIKNKKVPCWEKIVDLVSENHLALHYFDIIGWDITVDEEFNVICIEYNIREPGTQVYQFAHGPLAGETTDELLEFLLNKDMQSKYLPWQILK
ncbi:MAG: hypothetical protein IJ858_02845 [Acidaminococcaceae bacterium]|nr:hypothetical protein [Acidaminococcaceae bacterium]